MFFFNVIARRFLELLLIEVGLSAIFAAVFNFEIINSTVGNVAIFMTLELLVFFIAQTIMLRCCYLDIGHNRYYLILNFSAQAIFATVNALIYMLCSREIYTWFFGVFKVTHLLSNTGTVFSAALMHFILALITFGAPFGVSIRRNID